MNVEQMTNEEIAQYLTMHHTDYQKLTYEEWQELDAEAARRLRNSIPKPVVTIEEFVREVERRAEANMMKTGKLEGAHYAAMKQYQKELGLEGGGDE